MTSYRMGRWAIGGLLSMLPLMMGGGCDAINPALVASLGGNPASQLPDPDGYILVAFSNLTAGNVIVETNITYENGSEDTINNLIRAGRFLVYAENCELASFQVANATVSALGEATDIPTNLGVIDLNQDYFCGSVIAVTISGTAPNIDLTLEVY